MAIEITVPVLPESVADAELLAWHKQVGEAAARDEILVEVETDKIVLEVTAPADGALTEILQEAGATVKEGEVLARFEAGEVGAGDAVGDGDAGDGDPSRHPRSPLSGGGDGDVAAADSIGDGDAGDGDAGPSRHPRSPDSSRHPRSPLSGGGDGDAAADAGDGDVAGNSIGDGDAGDGDATVTDTRLSPAVRRMVAEHGLDIAAITGSGPGGRVTKEDVLAFIAAQVAPDDGDDDGDSDGEVDSTPSPTQTPSPTTQPSPQSTESKPSPETKPSPTATQSQSPASKPSPATSPSPSPTGPRESTRVPMTRLRRTIAARLVEAQQTAAILTTFNEVNMQPVMDLRAQYKDAFEDKHGARLGFMSFFVKASTAALQQFPLVNAYIDGDDIVSHNYCDIGIAVSSPRGLVVPVLRGAEALDFAAIETQIADFGKRAAAGSLALEDLTGGTFTITNGGVFGSLLSTPIINPPQSAILGMHAIQPRPVAEDGEVVIRPMMYVALSYDHRIIDGREAVGFLVEVKRKLESPARMLLQL